MTYTTLNDPLGTKGTDALGINNKGQIVGVYYDSSDIPHGFLYSHGHYKTLNDPLGTEGTEAFGINNKGQIVGDYFDANGRRIDRANEPLLIGAWPMNVQL